MKNFLWNVKFEIQFFLGKIAVWAMTGFQPSAFESMKEGKEVLKAVTKIREQAKTEDEYFDLMKEQYPDLYEGIEEQRKIRKELINDPEFQKLAKEIEESMKK